MSVLDVIGRDLPGKDLKFCEHKTRREYAGSGYIEVTEQMKSDSTWNRTMGGPKRNLVSTMAGARHRNSRERDSRSRAARGRHNRPRAVAQRGSGAVERFGRG